MISKVEYEKFVESIQNALNESQNGRIVDSLKKHTSNNKFEQEIRVYTAEGQFIGSLTVQQRNYNFAVVNETGNRRTYNYEYNLLSEHHTFQNAVKMAEIILMTAEFDGEGRIIPKETPFYTFNLSDGSEYQIKKNPLGIERFLKKILKEKPAFVGKRKYKTYQSVERFLT